MWVIGVLGVALLAGVLVGFVTLKLTTPDGPEAGGSRAPAAGEAVPRSVARLTMPGTTFLPVSVIRTPLRARLLGVLGLLLLVAVSSVVVTVIVIGGGRLFGRALEAYFGG
jgi:hypothetical protein